MYCSQCGTAANPEARFCQRCGAALKNETSGVIARTDPTESKPKSDAHQAKLEQSSDTGVGPKDQSKTFLGGIHHPWRRFFARTVDLLSLGLLILFLFSFLIGILFPQNIGGYVKAIENPITAGIFLYLLWLPVEAAFLAVTGTTPAKWVFGIRVLSIEGHKLSYSHALKRVFLVWVQGEGLGIPIVALFTRLFAYKRLTKTGTTLWDASVNSVVTHKKWGAIRSVASVLVVLLVMIIMGVLNSMGNK